MNALEYYHHLSHFTTIHGISRNPLQRYLKAREELKELFEAVMGGDRNEIVNEAGDLLNVCADIILTHQGNPLWVAYRKLEQAAARPEYQRLAAEVAQRNQGVGTI